MDLIWILTRTNFLLRSGPIRKVWTQIKGLRSCSFFTCDDGPVSTVIEELDKRIFMMFGISFKIIQGWGGTHGGGGAGDGSKPGQELIIAEDGFRILFSLPSHRIDIFPVKKIIIKATI